MSDEPGGLLSKLWRLSLTILGIVVVLWLSVTLLARIWWVLVIAGAIVVIAAAVVRWWQIHRW